MNLFKSNAKKLFVLLLALVASFALIACDKKDEVMLELDAALNSITLGNVSSLKADFDIVNKTNTHEFEIKWEIENTDGTLSLVKKDDAWTTVKVTPTAYTEDSEGKPTNKWGFGKLKATVEKEGKSSNREWELHVVPGEKTVSLTVSAIKGVAKDTGVEITGIVRYVAPSGLFVEDNTGAIYVYTSGAPGEGVTPGAEVNVKGKKDLYNAMPQISGATVKVTKPAPTAGYDYSSAQVAIIAEINAKTTADVDQFGKLVKITGKVVKDYVSPSNNQVVSEYAIKDETTNQTAAIYNSTPKAVRELLATKVGNYVTITVVTYDFHSLQLVWRHFGVEGTVVDAAAPTLTDEQIVANAKNQVDTTFKNKSFASDLKLPTTGASGGTISWSSNNTAVIANDGKLTVPAQDTQVELTYTITSGDVTVTETITVTALAVTKMTVKQAIDALDAADKFIYIEGVVVGRDTDGYYYVADETGVLFVRHQIADLVVGNKVKVMGTGLVYTATGNAQYTRQVSGNYTVTKLDNEIHASPLTAVDAQISDFDFTITNDQIKAKVPQEELYGKFVKINAFITIQGQYNNVYLATSTETGAPKILVYHKSMGDADLKALVGKQVVVTAVVYDYHVKDGWRLGFLNRPGDLVFELSNTEKLDFAKDEVETVVTENKAVSGNLDFFVNAKSALIATAKYTWVSNNTAVIANDGKFTAPTADTNVEITVKVFLDGNTAGTASAEWKYTVVAKAPVAVTGKVMISQAYGGGGNSGATLKSDFIELYNSSDQDIDITGWVVFYASKTSAFSLKNSSGNDAHFVLSGTIKAKSFYLIKASDGTGGTQTLPTPDATSPFMMGADGFKIALCNTNAVPTGPESANVVDLVGANTNVFEGTVAPSPSNTTAIVRANLVDTNNNGVDFTTAAPNPRNSTYKPN